MERNIYHIITKYKAAELLIFWNVCHFYYVVMFKRSFQPLPSRGNCLIEPKHTPLPNAWPGSVQEPLGRDKQVAYLGVAAKFPAFVKKVQVW